MGSKNGVWSWINWLMDFILSLNFGVNIDFIVEPTVVIGSCNLSLIQCLLEIFGWKGATEGKKENEAKHGLVRIARQFSRKQYRICASLQCRIFFQFSFRCCQFVYFTEKKNSQSKNSEIEAIFCKMIFGLENEWQWLGWILYTYMNTFVRKNSDPLL